VAAPGEERVGEGRFDGPAIGAGPSGIRPKSSSPVIVDILAQGPPVGSGPIAASLPVKEAIVPPDDISAFDLEAYHARIGDSGPLEPTSEVLDRIHQAHATMIPFENLDILLGRPIRIDLESLQAKLVRGRRGGYCFEQNTLFAAALERIGFRVTTLAARVRFGSTSLLPRTHMLLKVDLDDGPRLADVGFGGEGLLRPIRMEPGHESRQFHWTYRVLEEGPVLILQSLQPEGWFDLYAFTLDPNLPVDYEVSNHYTSTYPTSIFRRGPIVQRPTPEARYGLRGRELTIRRGDGSTVREIGDDDELLQVLSSTFGLDFPPGTRFGPAVP
jgi:N-hydroxyarylamine O-acetyltransferase